MMNDPKNALSQTELEQLKSYRPDTDLNESFEKEISLKRPTWNLKIEYLLSIFGYCVGLGNLWRFPMLCARNGGGAFLVPFFFILFSCGLPLFYLEVSLGQFSGKSPLVVWEISPLFKGLGLIMVTISGIVSWYYNTILAWVLYYFVHSFFPTLPWATCDNWWNTKACTIVTEDNNVQNISVSSRVINSSDAMFSITYTQNPVTVHDSSNNTATSISAAREFWTNNVLRQSNGIENIGLPQWHLMVAMAAAWILTFCCLVKGVRSLGKVVYITVTMPYILLTIFLIRGITLNGAVDGIIYYIKPNFNEIFRFEAWRDAAIQVFYSLGPSWGGLITMSSYNKFNNKCFRDALYGTLVDGLTSFYAGLVIFTFLGYMAHESGLTVKDTAISGPELVFIVYPEAIVTMPLSSLWAVLFFFMLLTVGIDSQLGMFETVSSGFIDAFPKQLGRRKVLTTAMICLILFVLSLIFTTKGAMYIFQLVDWYASVFCVLFCSLLECVVIAWIYGAERFSRDIELMTGMGIGKIIRFAWCIFTPIILFIVLCVGILGITPPDSQTYTYPDYAHTVGIIIALLTCSPVPLVMVYQILQADGSFIGRVKTLLKPSVNWRPNSEHLSIMYQEYKYPRSSCSKVRINLLGRK